jgi:guanylate kinase
LQIAIRLANARTEMAKRDVPGFFDGVVVNDTLEAGFESLKGALLACGLVSPAQPES